MVSTHEAETPYEQSPLVQDDVQIFYGEKCMGKGKITISEECVL